MRINKFLASCGLGSRRYVEDFITKGLIFVNDEKCTDLSTQIDEDKDIIKFIQPGGMKNRTLKLKNQKIYLALNKPRGYLVTQYDDHGRRTIYDLLPNEYKNVNYIGRLDYNSQGLLILTNDGELNQKITKPLYKIPKTYEVITDRPLTEKEFSTLQKGVIIEGQKTLPAKIFDVIDNKFTITIYQGKKRQIRLMVASIDAEVMELKRIQIGGLKIGNLELGKYRILDSKDIELLTK